MPPANRAPRPHAARLSLILWIIAVLFTLATFLYQDKTGPTYPLQGATPTAKGPVPFDFIRSETIGTGLKIMLLDPVPAGISGSVKYRRYSSNDEWTTVTMAPLESQVSRRGSTETVKGLGVELPSLSERAGKYEYFVYIDDGSGPRSVTGDEAILARYKAPVPTPVLVVHILTIFASMMFAVRTTLEAIVNGEYRWMLWATLISLLLGAFVLGPAVQWYAFGVWWSGIPFGFDWTDNKVLVELVFWVLALVLNTGGRRARWAVYLAGVVTLIVYFIPHSIFGSEYDYRAGAGRGTAG